MSSLECWGLMIIMIISPYLLLPLLKKAFDSYLEREALREKFSQQGIVVGVGEFGEATIPASVRMMHTHVSGATGSGKTTLLVRMAVQDMEARLPNGEPAYGIGVIDPKHDMIERLLENIPPWRRKDVIFFNAADTERPFGFNIIETLPGDDPELKVSQVLSVFKKMYAENWGPRLEYQLANALLALVEVPGSTLADIPPFITDRDFREKLLPYVTNSAVVNYWKKYPTNPRTVEEWSQSVLNKIGIWFSYEKLANIIDQVQSSFNIRQIMDEKKIFLASIPKGFLGKDIQGFLGALLISRFQLAAESRVDTPENKRNPFILYADEFQNFVTESSEEILTEGRSFGLGFVVANQVKSQFHDRPGMVDTLEYSVVTQLYAYAEEGKYLLKYTRLEDRLKEDWEKDKRWKLPPQQDQEKEEKENPLDKLVRLPPLPRRGGADQIIEDSRRRYGRDKKMVEADRERRRSYNHQSSKPPSSGSSKSQTQKAPPPKPPPIKKQKPPKTWDVPPAHFKVTDRR